MKQSVTVPYSAATVLRKRFEEFLTALTRQAHACQVTNPYRDQFLELHKAVAKAWVEPNLLPCDLPTRGRHYFCIYVEPPGPQEPYGEWVLFGYVERVVLCTCGKAKSEGCEHVRKEVGEWEDEGEGGQCERCRCRVCFEVNELFPLTNAEVMRTFKRYFELLPPVTGVGEWTGEEGAQQAVVGPAVAGPAVAGPARDGRGQRAVRRGLASSKALLRWMQQAENPKRFQVHREAWERLRRNEPGWDELTDVDHAFRCVARRCLEQIYGPGRMMGSV